MAKGQGPKFRLKMKRRDGKEIKVRDFKGEEGTAARATLGVVWENDGKLSFKFEDPRVEAAVMKVYGIPFDAEDPKAKGKGCWFDLFESDGGVKTGGGAKAADEDEDF